MNEAREPRRSKRLITVSHSSVPGTSPWAKGLARESSVSVEDLNTRILKAAANSSTLSMASEDPSMAIGIVEHAAFDSSKIDPNWGLPPPAEITAGGTGGSSQPPSVSPAPSVPPIPSAPSALPAPPAPSAPSALPTPPAHPTPTCPGQSKSERGKPRGRGGGGRGRGRGGRSGKSEGPKEVGKEGGKEGGKGAAVAPHSPTAPASAEIKTARVEEWVDGVVQASTEEEPSQSKSTAKGAPQEKDKRPYIPPAPQVKAKMAPEELEAKMKAAREVNQLYMERKAAADEDARAYEDLRRAEKEKANARKEEQKKIDQERKLAAERKLGKVAGREWDAEKKTEDWDHAKPFTNSLISSGRGTRGGSRGGGRGRPFPMNPTAQGFTPRGGSSERGGRGGRGRGGRGRGTTERPVEAPQVQDQSEFPALAASDAAAAEPEPKGEAVAAGEATNANT